jgi:hypothetical protein
VVADTLVRLFYKTESKFSLERGDKYDGRCAVDLCKDPNNYSQASLGGLESLGKLTGGLGKLGNLGDLMKGFGKVMGKQGAESAANAMI